MCPCRCFPLKDLVHGISGHHRYLYQYRPPIHVEDGHMQHTHLAAGRLHICNHWPLLYFPSLHQQKRHGNGKEDAAVLHHKGPGSELAVSWHIHSATWILQKPGQQIMHPCPDMQYTHKYKKPHSPEVLFSAFRSGIPKVPGYLSPAGPATGRIYCNQWKAQDPGNRMFQL